MEFILLIEKNLLFYINNLIQNQNQETRKIITKLLLIIICSMITIIDEEIEISDDGKNEQIYSFISNYSNNKINDKVVIYMLKQFFNKIQNNVI